MKVIKKENTSLLIRTYMIHSHCAWPELSEPHFHSDIRANNCNWRFFSAIFLFLFFSWVWLMNPIYFLIQDFIFIFILYSVSLGIKYLPRIHFTAYRKDISLCFPFFWRSAKKFSDFSEEFCQSKFWCLTIWSDFKEGVCTKTFRHHRGE